MVTALYVLAIFALVLLGVLIHDLVQKKHAILRNFPIVGHFRYLIESIGPEIRQYIITSDTDEKPFTRNQRRWVYSVSKKENDEFGFGSDKDQERTPSYLIFKHAAFAYDDPLSLDWEALGYPIPCAKILGGARRRAKAFRPSSVINVSGMSFGSLSGNAIEALNRGALLAGCYQSTGEGGISRYHDHGGDLVWNIGSGYFGCRDRDGNFSIEQFKKNVEKFKVKAVEIKLSQGAKPGLGGLLPGVKVTPEIAAARGIEVGQTCASPRRHTAFGNVDELLDFVELLAAESGLPIGIKSAVGDLSFWQELAEKMSASPDRGVDFIVIDGGEGGTGAAPLAFTDHVSLPFKLGFTAMYREFAKRGLDKKIVFVGAGKLGFPESALFAFSMGCDIVNVGREAMLAIGCIQAQKCHNNKCPTGVATQSKWLVRGLDPTLKSVRLANYIIGLRKEILRVSWSCGVSHPALLTPDTITILDEDYNSCSPLERFCYEKAWGVPSQEDQDLIAEIMGEFAPKVPKNQNKTNRPDPLEA